MTTDNNNVIHMPPPLTTLADRIRAAHQRTTHGRQEWIEGTLELAKFLAEAKERFPNTSEFSGWLGANDLEFYNKNDRAALINMATDLELARIVLQESIRTSYKYIWDEEMSLRVPQVGKSLTNPTEPEMPVESPPQMEDPAIPVSQEPVASGRPVPQPRVRPVKVPPSLAKLPKSSLVAEQFIHADAPRKIASWAKERGGRDVWNLMVQAIELGLAGPPTESLPTKPMLRAVLPWALGKDHDWAYLDLTKPANRDDVRDNLFPLLQEKPEFIGGDVVQQTFLRREWRQRRVDKENTLRRQMLVEEAERKAAEAKSEDESTVIIAYGTPLWPIASPPYTLQDLKCACWFTNMLMQSRFVEPGEKPKGTQLSITHLVKYIRPVALGFSKAVDAIANAYAANPTGESRMPRTPMAGEAEAHW